VFANSEPTSTGTAESQLWYVMPLDNDRHLIVNRGSGLVLNVKDSSRAPHWTVRQDPIQPTTTDTGQTWYLRPVAEDQPYDAAKIVNTNSNLYLGPNSCWDNGPAVSADLVQDDPLPADYPGSQAWSLQAAGAYQKLILPHAKRVPGDADAIADVDRLTGFLAPANDKTTETLIGSVLIPFPLVKDPVLNRRRQAQENPYYVLKRFGYWRNVYYYDHSGASAFTQKKEVTIGLTTSNAKQVEETAGVKVSANASFGFLGVGMEISAEAEYQLKTTTTDTTSTEHTVKTTIQRDYNAGKRVAEAIWYREDRFVLERLNGEKVLDWKILNPDRMVTDAYPAQS
jgi:Insecticidal Crystal Toxin, P42/Ricin-type beta-trefoil lectin domain-like